jgi:hypothetical protein
VPECSEPFMLVASSLVTTEASRGLSPTTG